MELLTYLIAGAIAGALAGLLGIGGGLVIVPVPGGHLMHLAVGSSLAAIIPTRSPRCCSMYSRSWFLFFIR